jgi:hypothetical protein
MKKISTFLFAVLLSASMAFSQPVKDFGVIPIGVTLNSILRLNIVSGGNIEFVVNTIDQYTNGIANTALYDTYFTVASSEDFNVIMYSESNNMSGTDLGGTMPSNNVGYIITNNGTGAVGTNWDFPIAAQDGLDITVTTIIAGIAHAAAGDPVQNSFIINWELGTSAGTMNATSLLVQSIDADRYVVNALLVLEAQ